MTSYTSSRIWRSGTRHTVIIPSRRSHSTQILPSSNLIPRGSPGDDLNLHIFLSHLQSLRMNTGTTTLPQPNLVMSILGSEFRQGAANPTLWGSDDERLPRWQSCRERDQPISYAGPLEDSESGTILFPDSTDPPTASHNADFSVPSPAA